MPIKNGKNRSQIKMMCLDDHVAKDSYVRVLDAFVDCLDLQSLGFKKRKAHRGRPSYNRKALLKLYFYGYRYGVRSSRSLERLCCINIEVQWLMGELKPKYHTIADFRKDNKIAFKNVFRQLNLMMKAKGLFDNSELVAIDSAFIRGQNSKKRNFTKKKIAFLIDYFDKQYMRYTAALDQGDAEEKQEAREWANYTEQTKEYYQELQQYMEKENLLQISETDPETRLMAENDKKLNVGYRVQIAVEDQHHLVTHFETDNKQDRQKGAEIAIAAKENMGKEELDALLDKGYHKGAELQEMEDNEITPYVSPPDLRYRKNRSGIDPAYDRSHFIYKADTDHYTCPEGHILKTSGKEYKKADRLVKEYRNVKACVRCPVKDKCTARDQGRVISRYDSEAAIERNRERIALNKNYYRQRSIIVEHVFGTVKRYWDMSYTLLKGKAGADAEYSLAYTNYNLLRLIKILKKDQLNSLFKAFLTTFSKFTQSGATQCLILINYNFRILTSKSFEYAR